jgi:hypothetical protein
MTCTKRVTRRRVSSTAALEAQFHAALEALRNDPAVRAATPRARAFLLNLLERGEAAAASSRPEAEEC